MSTGKTAQEFAEDARHHFRAGAHDTALRRANEGLSLFPGHLGLCDIKLAALKAAQGLDAAIAFFRDLPQEARTSWPIRRLAELLIEAGLLQEADELLQEAPAGTRAIQPYQIARIFLTERMDGPEAALAEALAFRRAHPERPELAAQAARLLEILDRDQEAIDWLEPALDRDAPWPHRRQLAQLYRKVGRPEQTIDVLQRAEHEVKDPAPGLFLDLAQVLEATGQKEDHLAAVERGLALHPQDPHLCRSKAIALRRLARPDDALDFVLSLPPDIQQQSLAGMVCSLLVEAERHDEADAFIASLPREAQSRPAFLPARLQIIHAREGLAAAVEFVDRSTEASLSDPAFALEAARLLRLAGRGEDAIAILAPLAPQAGPGPVLGRLARLYMDSGQPGETRRLLEPLHEAQQANAAMSDLLAQAHEEEDDRARALDVTEKALRRFPEDPDLLERHWRLLAALGGRDTAVEACRTVQASGTGSIQVQIAAHRFLTRVGDDEGIEAAFEEIGRIDPLHQRGAMMRANHLLRLKDAAGAREILEHVRDHHGPSRPVDQLLSTACFRLGLFDEAMDLLEPLAQDPVENPAAVQELVRFRQAIGDYDGAIAALDSLPLDKEGDANRRRATLANMAIERADVDAAVALTGEAVTLDPDDVYNWSRKALADLLAGDVAAAWESHRKWVKLRWMNDETGKLTMKVKRSLTGQILNEYRLLGDDPALVWSRPGQDQRIAAQKFKQCLSDNPTSTALALSLMTSLRRCGAIVETLADDTGPLPDEERIPRTLFQFWDTAEPPQQVAALMEENRRANPGYSYRRFDLMSARDYLRDKGERVALEAFRLAPNAAAKADILRLAVLWHEGGIYMDADDRCVAPLDSVLDHRLRFLAYQEPQMSVGNSFLAAQPRDPVIRAALDDAVNAFSGPQGEIVWLSTGPGAITRAVANIGTDEDGMLLPGIRLVSMQGLRRIVWPHVHLSYKSTAASWIRSFLHPDTGRRHLPGRPASVGSRP